MYSTRSASWEICMQVRKQQLELDMEQQTGSKLRKEYVKAVYRHHLFNLYAEYVMWNTEMDEAQAWIKIARRSINNLRYADDTTLMAESEEKLKSLLMNVKKESAYTLRKPEGKTVETVTDFILGGFNHFWGAQNRCRWWLQL